MTQKSMFWTTDNTGDGPAAGYAQQRVYDWLASVFVTDDVANEGVLFGIGNDLNITGTALPLLMEDGSAMAHGFFYENDSNFNVTGSSVPAIDTTGGRINLVINWTTQTIRVIANQSADGVSALPALIQNAGVEWHVPLYTYQVTTGGVVTLTDVRTFCHFATRIETGMIENEAVETAKIKDLNITYNKLATAVKDQLVTGGDTHAHSVGDGSPIPANGIQANAVVAGKIADGAVDTTATLANDIVDDTKVGNRVPQLYRRQGGSATLWDTPGATDRTPTTVRMQTGAIQWTGGSTNAGSIAITFPVAFDFSPNVIVSADATPGAVTIYAYTYLITDSGVTIGWKSDANQTAVTLRWMAIGPE